MTGSLDRYLSTLLTYTAASSSSLRESGDFACLIHVPANGTEKVYSVGLNERTVLFSHTDFQQTVSEYLKSGGGSKPSVKVVQSSLSGSNPAFDYLSDWTLRKCVDTGENQGSSDYYLLILSLGGQMRSTECWEPFSGEVTAWKDVIGSFEVLGEHFKRIASGKRSSLPECCDHWL